VFADCSAEALAGSRRVARQREKDRVASESNGICALANARGLEQAQGTGDGALPLVQPRRI
jgi:hypothetical protein